MEQETQISAFVSASTREMIEKYVRQTGMKKGRLVEEVLRHYLSALQELPADIVVPARMVLTKESFDKVLRAIRRRGSPTRALRDLMRGKHRGHSDPP